MEKGGRGSAMARVVAADDHTLAALGCADWPTWSCEASRFPWTYDQTEVCYLTKGEVTVTCANTGNQMELKEGDVGMFLEGFTCTWDVKKGVEKHYSFGTDLSALN